MMDGSMMNNSMMATMCLMMGIGLLILAIIVGVIIYVVARLLMKKIRVEDRPLMILKERFVKGEIDDEEFRQKRKMLSEASFK